MLENLAPYASPATCECDLPLPEATGVEARQVFDLPSPHYEVTEHRVLEARCACGKWHRSEFPEGVNAPVQYGPRLKLVRAYLQAGIMEGGLVRVPTKGTPQGVHFLHSYPRGC